MIFNCIFKYRYVTGHTFSAWRHKSELVRRQKGHYNQIPQSIASNVPSTTVSRSAGCTADITQVLISIFVFVLLRNA